MRRAAVRIIGGASEIADASSMRVRRTITRPAQQAQAPRRTFCKRHCDPRQERSFFGSVKALGIDAARGLAGETWSRRLCGPTRSGPSPLLEPDAPVACPTYAKPWRSELRHASTSSEQVPSRSCCDPAPRCFDTMASWQLHVSLTDGTPLMTLLIIPR